MNAGTALGLLAGLGAMNAMSGKPYGGKRFTGLMDMLDGGGAGQSGDKFEGGGLLSMLGNLFMKPLEAQQRVEEIAARTAARNNTTDSVLPPKTQADAEAEMGLGPFGGTGPTVIPPDVLGSNRGLLAAQAANEAAMGLDPFGGTGPMTYSGRGGGMPNVDGLLAGSDDFVSPSSPAIDDGGEGAIGYMPTVYRGDGERVDAMNRSNRDAMRRRMSTVTREQYDSMTRQEKQAAGLPVGGLDLAYVGADAFMPPMQYSGRGTSSGDPDFDEFMRLARGSNQFVNILDNPEAMRNLYNNYYKPVRAGNY